MPRGRGMLNYLEYYGRVRRIVDSTNLEGGTTEAVKGVVENFLHGGVGVAYHTTDLSMWRNVAHPVTMYFASHCNDHGKRSTRTSYSVLISSKRLWMKTSTHNYQDSAEPNCRDRGL